MKSYKEEELRFDAFHKCSYGAMLSFQGKPNTNHEGWLNHRMSKIRKKRLNKKEKGWIPLKKMYLQGRMRLLLK